MTLLVVLICAHVLFSYQNLDCVETVEGNASHRLVNGTLCDDCFLLNTVRTDVSHQVCDLLNCVTLSWVLYIITCRQSCVTVACKYGGSLVPPSNQGHLSSEQ